MSEDYKGRIGNLIRDARQHRGLTQQQLAERLSTSQSAINRIEKGHQNLSLEMLARIGSASRCSAPRCSTVAAPRCARSPGSRRSTGSSRC